MKLSLVALWSGRGVVREAYVLAEGLGRGQELKGNKQTIASFFFHIRLHL